MEMEVTAMKAHPLEDNAAERQWFEAACISYCAAYRRAVQAITGSLPTWAARNPAGRPPSIDTKHHAEIRELLALGVPATKLAAQFSTSRATIARIRDTGAAQ
jgi:hypothetical protein